MADEFIFTEEQQKADTDYFEELSGALQPSTSWPLYQAKQQAATVALMKGDDVLRDYQRVLGNLTSVGADRDVDNIRAEKAAEQQDLDDELAQAIAGSPELPGTMKVELLKDLTLLQDETATPTLRDAYVEERTLNATTNNATEERTHNVLMNNVDRIKRSNTEIERLVKDQILKLDTDIPQAVADFTATAVIPGFGFKLKHIIDEVLPEEGPAFHNLAPGEALSEYRRVMNKASPEERVEIAKRLITATEDMAGLIWQNDFEQFLFIQELLGDINPSDAEIQVDRWLNNLFGVLDILPAGVAAARGARAIHKHTRRGNVLEDMSETAPADAAKTMKAALEDASEETVDAISVTREEIVSTYALPKSTAGGTEVKVGPDINAILARPRLDTDGITTTSLNYTPDEKALAAERTVQRLEEVTEITPVEHLSKTVVEPVPGGISARTVVGPSENYGWSSVEELQDSVQDFLEVTEGATVNILKRDLDSNVYRPASGKDLVGEGEFLAQIDVTHLYNAADVQAKGFDEAVIGVSGNAAKYLNKTSVFQKWIAVAGNVAAENRAAEKAALIRTMEPFNRLSSSGQARVMNVLDEGDSWVNPTTGEHTGKWFSQDELVDRFEGNENLIRAYQSVREHQEKIYELQNKTLRNRLSSSGFQQVSNEAGTYASVAKPIARADVEGGNLTVLNPRRNTTEELSQADVDELYARGDMLARLPETELLGETLYDLVVIRATDETRVLRLPEYVLKKREGYVTKLYDTTHLVKKKISGVKRNGQLVKNETGATLNGKLLGDGEILVTVKMASNPAAAARAAKALNLSAKEGEEFGVLRARELEDIEYGNQASYEFYRDKGQLFFSKRGEEVESVTGERTLRSIAESLEVARNNAARHAGMDNLIESMTRRWELRYGHNFGVQTSSGPRFPVGESIPQPKDIALLDDWRDAVALRDHINMLGGIDTTSTRRNFTRMNIWVAEKLAGLGEGRLLGLNEKLSEAILARRESNILDVAKSLAFIKFIVLNPARQLVLQSQQASVMLGLDHGFKYFASGKGVRDWVGLTSGLAAIDRPNVWRVLAPQAAKGMGMSTKEYKEMVELFRKSGIPDSIDSHAFVQIMSLDKRAKVADSPLGLAAVHLQNGMENTLRLARKVGFDAGEYTNLSAAWLAVRNKWIKNNPGKDWRKADNLAQITGEARAVTFNMSAAGTLQQQKGLAGLMFQFMSHATKSIQVLIPDTKLTRNLKIGLLSDKAFNNRERLRIALTQGAIYGSGGLGLNALYRKVRDEVGAEVPPEVSRVIEEGLAGWTISAIFGAIGDESGEDTSLAFSTSFGPFSGTPQATPLHKIIPAIADAALLQSPDFRMLMPASVSAIHQIGETFRTVNFILNGVDLPTNAPSKWLVAAEQALTVASVYDNVLAARVASQIGQFTSRSGNPTAQAAGGEILARATLGLRTREEDQVGELLREITGTSTEVAEGLRDRIDGYAQKYATLVMKVFRQIEVQGDTIPAEAFRAIEPHITAMKLGLNEAEFFFFKQRLQERLFRDLGRNNATRLSNEINRLLAQGEDIGGSITTKIRNMEPFEGQEELVNLFNTLEGQLPVEIEVE